ncbi:MAG: methyltransferase [Rubripirellula sp.]
MNRSALDHPVTDPTAIFELFRGSHGSELLTAAVTHFDVFGRLNDSSMSLEDLRQAIGLQSRPATVLITALRAMGLIVEQDGVLKLTDLAAEHLVPGGAFDVGDYVGLAAQAPGVIGMVGLLKSNRPLGSEGDQGGAAFIYRDGIESAMEAEDSARHLTLALSGRAKNVAPALAEAAAMEDARVLLDVGGGTGIYSFALLQKNPHLKAIIFDRPEVLKVAEEMGAEYGVLDRTELIAGDMFADELPVNADVVLLSNILHDWDIPECQALVQRCASVLPPSGRLLIHDVFLNDAMDGPLPIALYSASLFSLTEGRAYSAQEYRGWLQEAGLIPHAIVPTKVHCGVLEGTREAGV